MSSCRAGEAGGDRDEAAGKKSPRAMHQCVTSVADGSARGSSTRKICAVLANHLLQAGVCVCVCVRAPGKASVSLCIWHEQYALLVNGMYVGSERATPADRDDDNCLLALCYRPRCRKSPPTVSLSRCVLSPSSMLSCLPDFQHTRCPLSLVPVRNGHVDSTNNNNAPRLRPVGDRGRHPSSSRATLMRLLHATDSCLQLHAPLLAVSKTETSRRPLATEL